MKARIRQDFVPQSRNLQMPSVVRLEGLAKEVETLPTRRKLLKRSEFKIYRDTVLRLRAAIVVAIRKIQQSEQRDYQQRYLARVGQIFLDAPPECWRRLSSRGETRPAGTCTPLHWRGCGPQPRSNSPNGAGAVRR